MTQTYQDVLVDLAKQDERILIVTAENRAAIRGVPDMMPERFIDVGICEMTMIGMSAGLASRGRIPVTHALATFLTMRAFEFIRTDVGIPGLPVKLVGCVPGFQSVANGPTHQAIEDIALMRGIPGMQVFCPADKDELLASLPHFVLSGKPAYMRYNESAPVVEHTPFEIGKAETFGEGDDVAILTYGPLLEQAMAAKTLLEASGISVRVTNMRTIEPLDTDAVLDATSSTNMTVVVEDHFQRGALYTAVAETLLQHQKTARVLPITLGDKWFVPALMNDVLTTEGFTGEQIAERIRGALG